MKTCELHRIKTKETKENQEKHRKLLYKKEILSRVVRLVSYFISVLTTSVYVHCPPPAHKKKKKKTRKNSGVECEGRNCQAVVCHTQS